MWTPPEYKSDTDDKGRNYVFFNISGTILKPQMSYVTDCLVTKELLSKISLLSPYLLTHISLSCCLIHCHDNVKIHLVV